MGAQTKNPSKRDGWIFSRITQSSDAIGRTLKCRANRLLLLFFFSTGLSSILFALTTDSEELNIVRQASIYALLTKLVRSRWLDIGQVLFFFAFSWTETKSRP